MPSSNQLENNLDGLRRRLAAAARRAGRDPAGIALVAVTKGVGPETAAALAVLGQLDLGESRASELERKAAWLAARGIEARWHFVGHLQRNKARRVAAIAAAIHSVDSLALLATLDALAQDVGRRPDVYLQVKLHTEETKHGLAPEELPEALAAARACRGLRLAGLMTIAPLIEDSAAALREARTVFHSLAQLAREHVAAFADAPRLSMGMSADFECAIEQGSDLVRVGSLLFAGLPPVGQERP